MSEQNANKRKYARYAFGAWFVGLAVFIIALAVVLIRAPSLSGDLDGEAKAMRKQALRAASGAFDPGYVMKNLAAPNSVNVPDPPFAARDDYLLLAYGLQGFYQSSPEGLPWRVEMPKKILAAQLFERGHLPQPVTEGVKVSWELAPSGGADGTVRYGAVSGEMQADDTNRSFRAVIDVTAFPKADEPFNPYQVISVKAEDASTGELLAQSDAVLAVSPDFGCSHCHAEPGYGILALHDKNNGTGLEQTARGGSVVECKSCHMELSVEDGAPQAGFVLDFSSAVHGWHAPFLADRASDACLTCHIGLAPAETPESAPRALFLRGVHLTRGLSCVNCHGYMEDHALALLKAEKEAGQEYAEPNMQRLKPREVKSVAEIKPRLAWVQEPACTGCHDFETKPVIYKVSGFNHWTELPSEGDGPQLFSRSEDLSGVVRCASCHGAPHALYAARNPVSDGLDNIPPLQYQEAAGPLGVWGNCAACHVQTMDVPPIHHPFVEVPAVEVQVPRDADLMMPRVHFPHILHTPLVECSVCHHTGYVEGRPIVCTGSGCHDAASPDKLKPDEEYRYFYQAFHADAMPSCNKCHEERQAKGLPAGPTDCSGCHQAPSGLWDGSN